MYRCMYRCSKHNACQVRFKSLQMPRTRPPKNASYSKGQGPKVPQERMEHDQAAIHAAKQLGTQAHNQNRWQTYCLNQKSLFGKRVFPVKNMPTRYNCISKLPRAGLSHARMCITCHDNAYVCVSPACFTFLQSSYFPAQSTSIQMPLACQGLGHHLSRPSEVASIGCARALEDCPAARVSSSVPAVTSCPPSLPGKLRQRCRCHVGPPSQILQGGQGLIIDSIVEDMQ